MVASAFGLAGVGWQEVPGPTPYKTREEVEKVVSEVFGGSTPGLIASYVGQLSALRHRIKVGDLLVMPMKTTKQLAIGRVASGYHYLAGEG